MASFDPLTLRLFRDADDLAVRQRLAADPQLIAQQLTQSLQLAAGWPALRDFLLRTVSERIPTLVYGDYDVDGSVSALLMFRWLRALGVPANFFLPSRFHHGYGIDRGIVETAANQGYQRILALDCGSTNLDEVALAASLGLEVAIIDHHTCMDELPRATLLNPHIDPEIPPLCTAGLVYAVLAALRLECGIGTEAGDELELAGLATIADIVPLTPPGWALAHHALFRLVQTSNIGLGELVKVSRLHGLAKLTGRQVAFELVPRLNAAGRMAQARIVVELLNTTDVQQARQLAQKVETLNQQRKETARRITDQAHAQALMYSEHSALVLHDEQWHPGVLGIVAARVAEQHAKPAIILGDAPGAPELWAGSARSFGGINLIETLGECSAHLFSFGGHAAAAGIKVGRDALDGFREAWSRAIGEVMQQLEHDASSSTERPVEAVRASLGELTAQFEENMWTLAPFGPEHRPPRFILAGRVARVDYMGAERTHISVTLSDGTRQARLAGFNMSHLAQRLKVGEAVAALVECEPDNWNNRGGIMLRLIEIDSARNG